MFSESRAQQRNVEQITETPAASFDEETNVHVPHVTEKTIEVVKFIPQERVQNRTVRQIIGVTVPRVMEENTEVEMLKPQLPEEESTLLADNKLTSKPDGGCAAQAPDWEQRQRVRAEELVTIHDTNKLLNDCDELIPKWLNFIEDVVDSEGLPLNVYRETLHQNKILRVIKKNHAKKCLDMFAEIAELSEDHKKNYEQFVNFMKLGLHEGLRWRF